MLISLGKIDKAKSSLLKLEKLFEVQYLKSLIGDLLKYDNRAIHQ